MRALATKYRPSTYEEVSSQESIIKILKQQTTQRTFIGCYLFCGPSGCGKTTIARIFGNEINQGKGTINEIDGASNNGVDNVRAIIEDAYERSLDSEYKIYVIDECVSGDTEVLTNEGWKRFDSLNKNEKIAQYNNGNIEFVVPDEYIEKEYNGPMYKVHIGNKATFIMSPNHVQPLYYNKSKNIKEHYIKDVKFAQTNRFIRSGFGVGNKTTLSILDRIAIMLQADGCLQNVYDDYNYWTINLKRENKISLLENYLINSNLEYKRITTKKDNIIRYSIKTPTNITKKLNSYFNIEDMSSEYANEFIEELMNWDGYKTKKYYYYSCIDKDNVDFCQTVGILGGFKSRINMQSDDNISHKNIYRLYLEKKLIGNTNSNVEKEEFQYNGKIYCVKVPSHNIIIRRDGFEMITGNCHMITTQGWNAFLKCIEEPPKYTIFIFCTTDPQKVPATILNRVMRFNLTKVNTDDIERRLEFICQQEGFTNYRESCDYISKISNGGMRDAIALLDKCSAYEKDLSIQNVLSALGSFSYETYFDLTESLLNKDDRNVLGIIEYIYNSGSDLKLFIEQYLSFLLDLSKYCIFNTFKMIKIPEVYTQRVMNVTGFNDSKKFYVDLVDLVLDIKNQIRYDSNAKDTVEIMLLQQCK